MMQKTILPLLLLLCVFAPAGAAGNTFWSGIGAEHARFSLSPEASAEFRENELVLARTFDDKAGEAKRFSAFCAFRRPVNLSGKIVAMELKCPAPVRYLRIQVVDRENRVAGSYLVPMPPEKPFTGTVFFALPGRAANAAFEEKLTAKDADSTQINRIAFHLIDSRPPKPGERIELAVSKVRFVSELPASAVPATPAPAPAAKEAAVEAPPLPETVYAARRSIDLSQPVIVKADAKLGEELREAFKRHWKQDVPLLSPDAALASGRPLVVYGAPGASELNTRLFRNGLLSANRQGYELRTIPDALDLKRDIVYLGGGDPARVRGGFARFFERFPSPGAIPHFIDCGPETPAPITPDQADQLIDGMRKHLASKDGQLNYYAIARVLPPVYTAYRAGGGQEYGRALLEMLRLFHHHYLKVDSDLQQFMAYTLFQMYDNIEEFELCTDLDRKEMAEVVRRITLSCRNHSAVLAQIVPAFRKQQPRYLLNSACFISRSLGTGARFLLKRYDYPAAGEWQSIADFAFSGVKPHPFSPEDAVGYQTMTYEIFIDYALANGLVDRNFFRSEGFKELVDYWKLQYNHQGWNPGYGDAFALYHVSGTEFLKIAAELLDDTEAEFILSRRQNGNPEHYRSDLTAPGLHTLGLNFRKLDAFKMEYDIAKNYFKRPVLDKASFRSGWEPSADYLFITGLNRGFHGHYDAASIGQYAAGDRLWLFEGDYVERFPIHHNTLAVSRDGLAPEQFFTVGPKLDAAAQILGSAQTSNRRAAALSVLLEDHNSVDFRRDLGYEANHGFWVIDRITARKAGEYALDLRFRTIGDAKLEGNRVTVTQPPSPQTGSPDAFHIVSGDASGVRLSRRFERGHAQKDGNLERYPLKNDPFTTILHKRQQQKLNAGDTVIFANFLQAQECGNPPPEVRRLGKNVFLAKTTHGLRLAAVGAFSLPGLEGDADVIFAGPEGLLGINVRRLAVNGKAVAPGSDGSVTLELPAAFTEACAKLGEPVVPAPAPQLAVPLAKPERMIDFLFKISAFAAGPGVFLVGCENGDFAVLDNANGNERFRVKLPAEVSAVAAVTDRQGKLYFLAGTGADRTGDDAICTLAAFDEKGKELWRNRYKVYLRRNSRITTIFPAKLATDADAVFVGTESWLGYALNLADGSERWNGTLHHGYTTGVAADMTGDGLDEIIPGGPYLYPIFFHSDGKPMARPTRSPGCDAVAAADLNGDGKAEALLGRHDGYLYCFNWNGRYQAELWNANVGGPVSGLTALPGGKTLAVTRSGNSAVVDAAGKPLAFHYFPAELTGLAVDGDFILATCRDGFAYALDQEGKPLRRYSFDDSFTSIHQPGAAISGNKVAVFGGDRLNIFSR